MQQRILLCLMVAATLPFISKAKNDATVPATNQHLTFLENKGQVVDQFQKERKDIDFSIGAKGMTLFIGDGKLHYQFSRILNSEALPSFNNRKSENIGKKREHPEVSMYRMDVELVGANRHAIAVPEQMQDAVTRFYKTSFTEHNSKGKQEMNITATSYNKITYKEVYPSIDWVIYTNGEEVEYEFVVRPGGNPSDIKLKYSGATGLEINKDGSLTATTPMGTVTEKTPVSFEAGGKRVPSSFQLNGDVVSFNVGSYTGTLTIDPTLLWGTYFGDASGLDDYKSVAYDGTGNIYLVGYTLSLSNMATVGAFQLTNAGGYDMFITRTTAAGVLSWSTFYGTSGDDIGWSIHYNGADIVIGGSTDALGTDDFMLGKLSLGGVPVYDWAIGYNGDEVCYQLERDASGNIYMGGYTSSTSLVATVGQTVYGGGGSDGYLVKCDNSTGNVIWGTYLGGTGFDAIITTDCDPSGNIYACGYTISSTNIATVGVSQQNLGGGYDGFITKYNNAGTKLWGTYWGDGGEDDLFGADVDASGNVYVTGLSNSVSGIATTGAYQTVHGGFEDIIVGKYNTNGIQQWGTYLGGSNDDEGFGLALDNSGNIYIAGISRSNSGIATTGSYDVSYDGGWDGVVAKFTNSGGMSWSTYYGGFGDDLMNLCTPDNAGNVFVCGGSTSTNAIALNTTIQMTNSGSYDAVIAKFSDCVSLSQPGLITGNNPVCAGSTQTYTIAAVTGATSYTWTLPVGWTGTSTTTSITVTVGTAGGSISVVANNSCGSSASQTQTVTVNPIPTATLVAAGATTFCQGGSVVLNASTGTGYSYQWYNGTTLITGAFSSSYTATASGTYTVQVTANGCSATSSAVTVTVNPAPATPTATSNSPVCAGAALNFTGNCTTTGVTYNWTGPNNFPNTQNPTIGSASLTDAGTYTLTVVNGNNCTATATTIVVVSTGAPATPSAITGASPVCEGTTNTYSVTNDVNAAMYNWTLPTGWSGSSATNSISATAGNAGGTISVTAQNGCGTSAPSTLNVTVNPAPAPVIVQSGGMLNTTATFTTYQWYDGSGMIPGATSQNYVPSSSGSYYVIVTDGNGCSGTSNSLTFNTAVTNVNSANGITLYPNPNSGSFSISGSFRTNDGKVLVEVVDIAGRVVHKEQILITKNTITTQVTLNTSIAPGVYTLKLHSDSQNSVIPFVKK